MFTQFFSSYLLNNSIITSEQLSEAIEAVKVTRAKLGVLAINSGYMTAEQVETVLAHQRTEDKRVGEIAVDMGFMTGEQVEELFSAQTPIHLVLGQVLVDKGFMTNAQFQNALNSYKEQNSISDDDFLGFSGENIHRAIAQFYEFDNSADEMMVDYIELLFKNIARFIGQDFMPMDSKQLTEYHFTNAAVGGVKGRFTCRCAVDGSASAYAGFALRYSGASITDNAADSSADSAVGDFLGLHNGMFAVNVSNIVGIDIRKEDAEFIRNATFTDMEDTFKISVVFPFGRINFITGSF